MTELIELPCSKTASHQFPELFRNSFVQAVLSGQSELMTILSFINAKQVFSVLISADKVLVRVF